MSKISVLFLNHKVHNCGVYQYGKNVYEILQKDSEINYFYKEIDSYQEYCSILSENADSNAIIYNYHASTMSWLNSDNIQRMVINIGIPHESPEHLFDIICNIDPTAPEELNRFSLPRPIYENIDELLTDYNPTTKSIKEFIEYSEEGVPIFGSFGFGFTFKGFDKIITIINEQFDSAIIKFIIPGAYFDGNRDNTNSTIRNLCESVPKKSTIKLMIIHEFCSNEDILYFLKSNTMNIFLYDKLEGRGISSVLDYAISVKKPFAISDSNMFRHIYSDEICVYKTSINDCMNYFEKHCELFLRENSNNNLINKFKYIMQIRNNSEKTNDTNNDTINEVKYIKKLRGIFYNSQKSLCSIWESGKMCYDALKNSNIFVLDYSEEQKLDFSYDFAIFNQHFSVNKWMNANIIQYFNKPTFCIVTEVSFSQNPIEFSPNYFSHYIVLDPTINETNNIHSFGRPLENFDLSKVDQTIIPYEIPKIFSFGFATPGKEWHKIVELVQNDYDKAFIHLNIPKGTHVSNETHNSEINNIIKKCKSIITKPEIFIRITSENYSKDELIKLCATKTINCFYYNRNHLYLAGLSAVTDQAISSGRPLFVTNDRTFRHIHKYINCYPYIGIKKAIENTQEGVLKMKEDWSSKNFLIKFEKILASS